MPMARPAAAARNEGGRMKIMALCVVALMLAGWLVAAPAAAQDGLPPALTAALARHRIVVVSLYAPKVELDDMALQEAKAGAAGAGAGFVAVNVMSEAESRQLTKQLGVLEDPAVLVFKRPGDLVTRFSGFADQQTILQAARNAAL